MKASWVGFYFDYQKIKESQRSCSRTVRHHFVRQQSYKIREFHTAHNFILRRVTVLQAYRCFYFCEELGG